MAKIELPDRIFGKQVDGAMERVLKAEQEKQTAQPPIVNAPSLDGFIYVPSINLYVAKQRELNGLNWEQAIDKIYKQGIKIQGARAEMPTPFEFMTFINYLLLGNVPHLQDSERKNILDDILKTGDYRGNHLNAKFVQGAGFNNIAIEKAEFDSSGKLVIKQEPLEVCLWQDCYAELSINKQGLLTKSADINSYEQGKNIYFWYPRVGRVARLDAYSSGADLYCSRHPGNSYSSLGVRACAKGAARKK